MAPTQWPGGSRWRGFLRLWPWLLLTVAFLLVRATKGAGFADAYALLSRPFWPGPAQSEWLDAAADLETKAAVQLLEADNRRLRALLGLQESGKSQTDRSAAVISRSPRGWWQQLELGKGSIDGIKAGDAVMGPGGLVGQVQSVTPVTSRVKLLTAPGTEVGVWLPRSRSHALLVGMGSSRPQLRFIEKDPNVRPGDLVSTSPASTLLPANLPVGVVQSVDERAVPAPHAVVQLIAAPEAIDWVQVRRR